MLLCTCTFFLHHDIRMYDFFYGPTAPEINYSSSSSSTTKDTFINIVYSQGLMDARNSVPQFTLNGSRIILCESGTRDYKEILSVDWCSTHDFVLRKIKNSQVVNKFEYNT